MNLETIFGLANIDKIFEFLIGIITAMLSPASLTVIWVLALLGGSMLFFEFIVEWMYNRYIVYGKVTVDKDLEVPVKVGADGNRLVIVPETVEYLQQEAKSISDDTPEYVDTNHKMINALNGVLFILTLPVSFIVYLLIFIGLRSLMKQGDLLIAVKLLRLAEWSSKVTGVLKWVWTSIFTLILLFVGLVIFIVVSIYIATKFI